MACADDAVDAVLEAEPAAVALRAFMAHQPFMLGDEGDTTEFRYWKGSGKSLFASLTVLAPEGAVRSRVWPRDAIRLSRRLALAAPALKLRGVTFKRGRLNRARWIEIMAADMADTEADAP